MNTKLKIFIRNILKQYPFEKIIRKLSKNKSNLGFWSKLVPPNLTYVKGSVKVFKHNQINLKLDISDYLGHYIYFGFKDVLNDKLFSLVKENNCIIDVGTNNGYLILKMASLVGNAGFCYGFEPDPINYSTAINNINLNHFNNIKIENLALGSENFKTNLVTDTESNRSGNRLINFCANKENIEVDVLKFDDWIKNKPEINKIDLVKIDVEGYEFKVLIGGLNSWKKYKPILIIELDDNNLKLQNTSAEQLLILLESLNYEIKDVYGNNITSKVSLQGKHFDIICTYYEK